MMAGNQKDSAMLAGVFEVLVFGLTTKAEMIAAGEREDTRTCPRCGGIVVFRLVGPRDHLRMACRSEGCNVGMME